MKKLISLAMAFIMSFMIVTAVSPTAAEAASKPARPAKLFFVKWTNKNFTGYVYKLKLVQHVDGIQTVFLTSSGISKTSSYEPAGGLSSGWWTTTVKNSPSNKIVIFYTRTYNYNSYGNRVYSNWSRSCGIIPWPKNVSFSIYNASKKQIKAKWNNIDWNNGYNVMITTNPAGSWHFAKSNVKGTSTVLKNYRGSSFKKYKNYYVRVVTRNKIGSVTYTAPAPTARYYQNGFRIY